MNTIKLMKLKSYVTLKIINQLPLQFGGLTPNSKKKLLDNNGRVHLRKKRRKIYEGNDSFYNSGGKRALIYG